MDIKIQVSSTRQQTHSRFPRTIAVYLKMYIIICIITVLLGAINAAILTGVAHSNPGGGVAIAIFPLTLFLLAVAALLFVAISMVLLGAVLRSIGKVIIRALKAIASHLH
ncbi:hypothetical protein ORI20_30765 [Mycobacterium sp. CVI_P3]|uniref:Transmembrane protein n=1 Tax=Mycobacterium pinniadriaticum TaxID=2994102 RepID=A0ABT3SNP3_9MYCO|nr:hypothetical protein [Mycobacterium pinniadriaticum]MCX2934655.1 hypothetical protein [Mycobacterium pinniadriaticum]MCX2941078.1 hypothetical protein [Mycobacterium pinniadriaticum]